MSRPTVRRCIHLPDPRVEQPQRHEGSILMRTISGIAAPRAVSARFVVALLVGAAGLSSTCIHASPRLLEPPDVCVGAQASTLERKTTATRFDGDAFVRTELFFGSERPDLPEVSAEEFKQFLDVAVTPCFPDGLTLLTGKGQFRESSGQIVQETSFVL